jgi:hypothetical protein
MPIRFVCLANSKKEGGRCVAGILLDKNNKPIIGKLGPKWIRPIYNNEHGEIPTGLVSHIQILDIVEIEVDTYQTQGYQSENASFDENSIDVVDSYQIAELGGLCEDERPKLFGNTGKAIHPDKIYLLHYSLMLIQVDDFTVHEKPHEYNPDKTQFRLEFLYKRNKYDFAITDPVFLGNYKKNDQYLSGVSTLFLTLSVGVKHMDWYHKLVAGIILS